jgi:ABC-type multidrug transport system permease subunit
MCCYGALEQHPAAQVCVCADAAYYYFLFVAVVITTSLAVSSIFRLLGAAFQSPPVAQGVGGFFLLLLVINSGFIIVRKAIPDWVIFFYWISPFAYSIRALAINEFTSPRWTQNGRDLGAVALGQFDMFTERRAPT